MSVRVALGEPCGCRPMVRRLPSKQKMRVQFPLSTPVIYRLVTQRQSALLIRAESAVQLRPSLLLDVTFCDIKFLQRVSFNRRTVVSVSIHASILNISARNRQICSNATLNIRKMQHVNNDNRRSNLLLTYNIVLLKSIGFSRYPVTHIVTHLVALRIDK